MIMRAMEFRSPGTPLRPVERAVPCPGPGEVLIEVSACAVCRTDLHIVDGDIEGMRPVIPGHEVVGRVTGLGPGVTDVAPGDRVGVPWLGATCGRCFYCTHDAENLCDSPAFTGFTRDGGFATHLVADQRFCLPLPPTMSDVEAAPLLCAGLIGFRAYRMAGAAERLGIYGFGAAAHLLAQVASADGRRVFAFTKPGDAPGQAFARGLGCTWAGGSDQAPPEPLDAGIIFAPVGALVPAALRHVRKGGRVVCGGIHMSDMPAFPYADLWGERSIISVSNLTRGDGRDFMARIARQPVQVTTKTYRLADANAALDDLRAGAIAGAAVLLP